MGLGSCAGLDKQPRFAGKGLEQCVSAGINLIHSCRCFTVNSGFVLSPTALRKK